MSHKTINESLKKNGAHKQHWNVKNARKTLLQNTGKRSLLNVENKTETKKRSCTKTQGKRKESHLLVGSYIEADLFRFGLGDSGPFRRPGASLPLTGPSLSAPWLPWRPLEGAEERVEESLLPEGDLSKERFSVLPVPPSCGGGREE